MPLIATAAPALNYALLDQSGHYSGPRANEALGSLWKLFVYSYIVEAQITAPPYVCQGQSKEEAFCCEKGKSIALPDALKKSCGPFFAPARLGIPQKNWQSFWQEKGFHENWLLSLNKLKPDTKVSVENLLGAIQGLRNLPRFPLVESSLLQVVLSGTGSVASRAFGGLLRAKTFTWNDEQNPDAAFAGGFAGYLQDGTAIWFKGNGSSREAIRAHREQLLPILAAHSSTNDQGCVIVRHVARYPIASIAGAAGETPSPGVLRGGFTLKFKNGNRSSFQSGGQISLSFKDGHPMLTGRYSLTEYVARVLEREVTAYPPEASKAMAILVRSYLLANATRSGGCYHIEDSTHAQRVSMNRPSAASLAYAAFTAPLVMTGITPRYHFNPKSPQVLSLSETLRLARAGYQYDEILARFFPSGTLAPAMFPEADCRRFGRAKQWLAQRTTSWERRLRALDGFESVRPEICQSKNGKAFSDPTTQRIYLTSFRDSEDEISLAHEFLHLTFQHHPRGIDEAFVESTAQSLIRNGETL